MFLLQWNWEKNLDIHKKRQILKFFIETFTDIAQKSIQISTKNQALFYIKQARYLVAILEDECSAFGEEVVEIMEVINQLQDSCDQLNNETAGNLNGVPQQVKADNKITIITERNKESISDKPLVNINADDSENLENNGVSKKNVRRKTVAFVDTPEVS